jgi:hypothetical protein
MRIALLIILIFSSFLSYSQDVARANIKVKDNPVISVISAKSQRWSGGVTGSNNMGCKYYIDFVIYLHGKEIKADTIWIGNKCYPICTYEGNFPTDENANCKLTKGKDKWTYSFFINQGESNGSSNVPDAGRNKNEEAQPKAPDYKGAAAIRYTFNHRERLKVIQSFKQLPAINYP